MRDRRLARSLLYPLCLLCLASGCQVFNKDREIRVLVRDAETKKPVPTAEVYLCHRLKGDEVAPCHAMGLTQEDGIAQLRTETPGEHGIQLQAVAQGYLPEKLNAAADTLKPRADGENPTDFVIETYAEPGFTVELIVPPGYRGVVKAALLLRNELSCPPGQRCFRYAIDSTGSVQVTGPSLLRRVAPADFRARSADNTLLPATMDAKKVGFRWIKSEGDVQYFVVGTLSEYEDAFRRLKPEQVKTASGIGDVAEHAKKRFKGRKPDE